MGRTQTALVSPSVLVWARDQVKMPLLAAAKKASVSEETLLAWEGAKARPTIRQARLLAAAYRVPLAAFFLDEPPAIATRVPRDFRRFAGSSLDALSSNLHIEIRDSWQKREIALELLLSRGQSPPSFEYSVELTSDSEAAGAKLRRALKVSIEAQTSWRDSRKAFNAWRSLSEGAGVMVMQTSDVPLEELRAYSLYATKLPVVVVNRKDAPLGRVFSLLHELVHLGLHTEGVCDLTTASDRPPEDQRLEVFCNAVAAAALIPKTSLLAQPLVSRHSSTPIWDNVEIEELSRTYSTSREALLRRLLTLGLTNEKFYLQKRDEYAKEYAARTPRKGFIAPPADALSLYGKPFVRLVLDGLDSGSVTTSDAADYLGLRLKHLPALAASLETEQA